VELPIVAQMRGAERSNRLRADVALAEML